MSTLVIPAQIRAARALLDWSQETLATTAGVALSSVRDLESQKRPADSATAKDVRRALENEGVIFVSGGADGGPGVRLADNRPYLVRRPTTVTQWEGVPFEIEWQGKATTAFVSREVLEDLDEITGTASDEALLEAFEKHRGRILTAAGQAIMDPQNFDKRGHLYVRGKDVFPTKLEVGQLPLGAQGNALAQFPKTLKGLRLRPLPKRIWGGEPQKSVDYRWVIQSVYPDKGKIVIGNPATGHFLPLYSAHVRRVTMDLPAGSHEAEDGFLELAVQIVFEDGHVRLEPL